MSSDTFWYHKRRGNGIAIIKERKAAHSMLVSFLRENTLRVPHTSEVNCFISLPINSPNCLRSSPCWTQWSAGQAGYCKWAKANHRPITVMDGESHAVSRMVWYHPHGCQLTSAIKFNMERCLRCQGGVQHVQAVIPRLAWGQMVPGATAAQAPSGDITQPSLVFGPETFYQRSVISTHWACGIWFSQSKTVTRAHWPHNTIANQVSDSAKHMEVFRLFQRAFILHFKPETIFDVFYAHILWF